MLNVRILLIAVLCTALLGAGLLQIGLSSFEGNSITAIGATNGTSEVTKHDDDTWGFTQDVLVHFQRPLTKHPAVSVDPEPIATPMVLKHVQVDLDKSTLAQTIEIRWQKAPSTVYKVTLLNPVIRTPIGSFSVRTPRVIPTPEAPVKSKRSDSYYYGSLEHSAVYPFGLKLPNSGQIDPRALSALSSQRIQFVRFGPTPAEVAYGETGPQSRASFSFASTDPTIDSLHRSGIEVLYVIDAGGAPPWGNPNTLKEKRPVFETPTLYAEYCTGVAAHLAEKYPTIRRVEIGTNEPNYPENWTNAQARLDGMPEFADQTGRGLAPFLMACYKAVKSVAPRISVVAPGIALGGKSLGFLPYIDALYAAGCRTGKCWDIFSVHSYTWSDPSAPVDLTFADNLYGPGDGTTGFYSYRDAQARDVLDGDKSPPKVMITETGFSSAERQAQGVDPRLQAYYASVAFNQYLRDPSIMGIVWADIVNHDSSKSIFSGIATLDKNMQPKPVFDVIRTFSTF